MESETDYSIKWLLQELSDPFAILPLQDVARSLGESISESQEAFNERAGPYGVARKYWDVPMEMIDDGIGIAIGSVFVLGQAAIAQSISIVWKIRELSHSPVIPCKKRVLLETEAPLSLKANLSSMVIIDTAANYFKHHYEWPKNWHISMNGSGVQKQTMEDAKRLGMSEHKLTNNMVNALLSLSLSTHDLFSIPMSVQEWRERLAVKFSNALGIDIE